MLMKSYLLLTVTILSLFYAGISLAKTKEKIPLKITIKSDTPLPIDKELTALAKQMQESATIYDTTNKQDYWKSEGKKSVLRLLNSYGYYAAVVEAETESDNQNVLMLYVYPYQRYKISSINITHAPISNQLITLPSLEDLDIKSGDYAVTLKIIAAQHKIFDYLEENNCLLNLSVSHEVILNHIEDSVEVSLVVKAGQSAKVESISFEGLESINSEYVRKIVQIENGVCFKRSLIEKAKTKLQKSGLFASVMPVVPEKTMNGVVPVFFNVKERKHRSLTAGLQYGVDLGIGASLGWRHRNFNSNGEELSSSIVATKKEQLFDTNYTIPFFLQDNQTLRIGGGVKNIKSKAYDSRESSLYSAIERKVSDIDTIGIGSKLSFDEIRENGFKKDPAIFSLPLFSSRDTRDNILDPHLGHFLKAELAPSLNLKENKTSFVKGSILGSAYLSLDNKEDMTVAFRGKVGSIFGIRASRLPATERFYVGGFNSVRGYDYQLAGELNQKRPIGGRASLETSIEFRKKIKDNIGAVVFFDSGNNYDSLFPTLNKKLYNGVGVGLRYHTDFAPLRVDIAIPLHRRKGVDRAFQFYFGIGQSF